MTPAPFVFLFLMPLGFQGPSDPYCADTLRWEINVPAVSPVGFSGQWILGSPPNQFPGPLTVPLSNRITSVWNGSHSGAGKCRITKIGGVWLLLFYRDALDGGGTAAYYTLSLTCSGGANFVLGSFTGQGWSGWPATLAITPR